MAAEVRLGQGWEEFEQSWYRKRAEPMEKRGTRSDGVAGTRKLREVWPQSRGREASLGQGGKEKKGVTRGQAARKDVVMSGPIRARGSHLWKTDRVAGGTQGGWRTGRRVGGRQAGQQQGSREEGGTRGGMKALRVLRPARKARQGRATRKGVDAYGQEETCS